ncbi:MAG: MBOAT family protein [Ruminococcus sp.]|nr:MBOAT family protein [Ruminococcus sp.]
MVFADLFFIYFFMPLCLLIYFVAHSIPARNVVLLVFSLIFYAWGEPVWVVMLIAYSFLNFMTGKVIGRAKTQKTKKCALALAIGVDIGVLALFKYSGFLVENVNALLHVSIPVPDIKLPIGISFYTFQTLSYSIDCYWGKVKVQKHFHKFLLYVSMFPQLIAGPIVRYSTIAEEIDNRHTNLRDISEGFSRIILGIGKKVIIANSLNTVVTSVFGTAENGYSGVGTVSVLAAWGGAAMVALWYYFDFSGYSDIAIGLGRIFGFHFDENFRYPFICKSITEFWQRWHISLGTFFRDYLLYVPIFGKRRKYGGLFLVWFCTGLWHGASWNFVIWGLYYGLFVFIEMKLGKKRYKNWNPVFAHIYTKLVIILGFGIFYFEDFGALGKFFKALVGANGNAFSSVVTRKIYLANIFLIIAAVLLVTPIIPKIKELAARSAGKYYLVRSAGVLLNAGILIISSLLLLNTTNNPFLYFRF